MGTDDFEWRLRSRPRDWSIVISVRAALRTLPFASPPKFNVSTTNALVLPIFRALAISRFSALFPARRAEIGAAVSTANDAIYSAASYAAARSNSESRVAAEATYTAIRVANVRDVADPTDAAGRMIATASGGARAALKSDLGALTNGLRTSAELTIAPLWQVNPALRGSMISSWHRLAARLQGVDESWSVWVSWYEYVLYGVPPKHQMSAAWETAFTDVLEPLPWDVGAVVVNRIIRDRLTKIDETVSLSEEASSENWKQQSDRKRGSSIRMAIKASSQVGRAVTQNERDIILASEALIALLNEKINSLRADPPNSSESNELQWQDIAEYEFLRQRLVAFRAMASDFVRGQIQEENVIESAISLSEGISAWWTKNHARICDRVFDASLFVSYVGVCSLSGAGGPLAVAISAVLVRGKPILDALKALPKILPKIQR